MTHLSESSTLNYFTQEQSIESTQLPMLDPASSGNGNASHDSSAESSSILQALFAKPYSWWKEINPSYSDSRKKFLSNGPFKLWLCDDPCLNTFSLQKTPSSLGTTRKKSSRAEHNSTQGYEVDSNKGRYQGGINDESLCVKKAKKVKVDDLNNTDSDMILEGIS